jgi:hypothetical protein
MRLHVILATACALVFFGVGLAKADEISDLKDQLRELSEKVEELEAVPSGGSGGSVNVGGHLKFYMVDQSDGQRNSVDQNNNLSAGIHDFWFYLGKGLSDWLMLDVQTKTSVLAAATPRLGSDITRSTTASFSTIIDQAYMTVLLPREVELRVGAFYPLFSEEYGSQIWWDEQYHGNVGLLRLEAWYDNGIELYRNFDFEAFSLPVYLYLLNGDNRYVDNNAGMMGLVHLAPEFFGNKLRLLGSLGAGKWDDNDDQDTLRYAVGAEFKYQKLNIMGEYLTKQFDSLPLSGAGTADGEDTGYYIKALYSFREKWRGLVKYSDVELFNASTTMLTDTYKTISLGVNYFIADSSLIMLQVSFVDADRSDGSETLEYIRTTLGWRTTF